MTRKIRNNIPTYRLDEDDKCRIKEAWLKARRANKDVVVMLNDDESTTFTIDKWSLAGDYWHEQRRFTLHINRTEVDELRRWAKEIEREEWAAEQMKTGAGEYTFEDMLYLRDRGARVTIMTSTPVDGQALYACRVEKVYDFEKQIGLTINIRHVSELAVEF